MGISARIAHPFWTRRRDREGLPDEPDQIGIAAAIDQRRYHARTSLRGIATE